MIEIDHHIAQRVSELDSSTMIQAFQLTRSYPDAIDLTVGRPIEPTPSTIKQAGVDAISNNLTKYTAAAGIQPLRNAIAHKLRSENQLPIQADHICVTPGLTAAILLVYLAMLNPDDEVIVPEPYFPPYKDVASLVGAKVVVAPTDDSFKLTPEQLNDCLSEKTKLLILNNPNNPSGAVYSGDELSALALALEQHDVVVVSDEIYEHFQASTPVSFGTLYDKTITLNGFSKAYAMTGWRLGYIAGHHKLIENIVQLAQYLVFCSSSIAQHAALAAIEQSVTSIAQRYVDELPKLKQKLSAFVEINGMDGAFYGFIPVPDGMDDITAQNVLAQKYGLLTLPGRIFSSANHHIRLAFTRSEADNMRAVDQLQKFYNDNSR